MIRHLALWWLVLLFIGALCMVGGFLAICVHLWAEDDPNGYEPLWKT